MYLPALIQSHTTQQKQQTASSLIGYCLILSLVGKLRKLNMYSLKVDAIYIRCEESAQHQGRFR